MPSYHWRETAAILVYARDYPFSLMRMPRLRGAARRGTGGLRLEESAAGILPPRPRREGLNRLGGSTPDPRPTTATPYGRVEGAEAPVGQPGDPQATFREQLRSRENMRFAWQRVKANKGAAGMDGLSIDAFPAFAPHHWERLRSALEEGTYRPAAVRRVMIPKASGGERPLGSGSKVSPPCGNRGWPFMTGSRPRDRRNRPVRTRMPGGVGGGS